MQFDEGRFSWDGVYFGIGVGRVEVSAKDPVADPSPTAAQPTSNVFTGFGGVNRQRGNTVFGFEGDISFGSVDDTNQPFGFLTPVELEFLSTLRG